MKKKEFLLELIEPEAGIRYQRLMFGQYLEDSTFKDPVIEEVCGEEMNYGALFTYLFRRFGYPNTGWDNYKELTAYHLSTPHPDMLLEIVPHIESTARFQLRFMVTQAVHSAVEAYARRAQDAWKMRAIQWLEMKGLPDWMEEWRQYCNSPETGLRQMGVECAHWTDTIGWMTLGPYGTEGSEVHRQTARAHAFHKQWLADYEQMEPCPAYGYRTTDWRTWDPMDPLKPLVEAAQSALRDLSRPVGVRDLAINAYGYADFNDSAVEHAPVAGYPSGDLGNQAPREFSELHSLIIRLGEGDAKRGIEKANTLLTQALSEY